MNLPPPRAPPLKAQSRGQEFDGGVVWDTVASAFLAGVGVVAGVAWYVHRATVSEMQGAGLGVCDEGSEPATTVVELQNVTRVGSRVGITMHRLARLAASAVGS